MPPDSPTPSEEQRGAIFADVCDSTRFCEELGDQQARRLVMDVLEVVRRAGEAHGGRVVDRIGDELFLLFPSCAELVEAAVDIQSSLTEAVDPGELPSTVALCVGCHFGSVVLDGDGVFAETVHVAKRAISVAKAGQIVTTAETTQRLGESTAIESRFRESVRLKGQTRETELFEVMRGPGATFDLDVNSLLARARPASLLLLELGEREYAVSTERPSMSSSVVSRTTP